MNLQTNAIAATVPAGWSESGVSLERDLVTPCGFTGNCALCPGERNVCSLLAGIGEVEITKWQRRRNSSRVNNIISYLCVCVCFVYINLLACREP